MNARKTVLGLIGIPAIALAGVLWLRLRTVDVPTASFAGEQPSELSGAEAKSAITSVPHVDSAPMPAPPEPAGDVEQAPLSVVTSMNHANAVDYYTLGRSRGQRAVNEALLNREVSFDERLEAAREALLGWASVDPEAAMQDAASLMFPGQDYLLFALPYVLVEWDAQKTLEWTFETVPPEHRRGAAQHTMIALLQHHPQAAYGWLSDRLNTVDNFSFPELAALNEIVIHSARYDVTYAKQFVNGFPDGNVFSQGALSLLNFLYSESPDVANDWLDGQLVRRQLEPDLRDALLVEQALLNSRDNYLLANQLTNEISDDAQKRLVQDELARRAARQP